MLRVTFEGVAHRFPTGVEALGPLTLEAAPGEFLAVVGPSGCGKTTLLRTAAGLLRPSGGRVLIGGDPLSGPAASVGMVFQQPALLPWRTVIQNVALPLEMRGVPPSVRRAQADAVLAALGLADFRDRFVAELSGGMAQRAALGRALIYDPKVLLLDEPFGALDALTREALQLDLLRLWGQTGKTIILVTHSITEAAFMADRVAVLSTRPGRLRAVVPIPLPRPRQHAMIHSEEFGILVAQIRANIEAGGNVANQ